MKIIQPTYEIMEHPDQTDHDAVLQYIERIGRVCYKSEEKITAESAPEFCRKLKDRKHWAMLEHFRFTYFCSDRALRSIKAILGFPHPDDAEFISRSEYLLVTENPDRPNETRGMISFSATTLNYLVATKTMRSPVLFHHPINELFNMMLINFPALMEPPKNWPRGNVSPLYTFVPVSQADVMKQPAWETSIHGWMSVWFTTDRGITHELVRHRNHTSFAQESTRYCNYQAGKFGEEITVVAQPDIEEASPAYEVWLESCKNAEASYLHLTDMDIPPQLARSVLPTCTKAEIVVTAPYVEWKHIFNMRCPGSAHPGMRQVMLPLFKDMINPAPRWDIFRDQAHLLEGAV